MGKTLIIWEFVLVPPGAGMCHEEEFSAIPFVKHRNICKIQKFCNTKKKSGAGISPLCALP